MRKIYLILRIIKVPPVGIFLIGILHLNCAESQIQKATSLKDAFKNHFLIGVALNSDQILEQNKIAKELVKDQFNSITSENELKWERVHPEPNKYNFELSDKFVAYGEKLNMFLIGHVLVWHQQTPQWVFENEKGKPSNREELLNRLREHIYKVVGRYKGKIKGWDVVNEALDEDGSLKQSEWLKIIGDDYLVKAFEFAHQADPEAELYYNDFSLENKPKRDGAVKLIMQLKSEGAHISGVGLQGHYKMDWPTANQLDSTIKAFAELGIKVMITELDIDVLPYDLQNYTADINYNLEEREELNPFKNGLPDSVQRAFTERYSGLFKVFIENNNTINRITFWGVNDKESWLNNWPIIGRTSYPLLFDREGKEKPAYKAVVNLVPKY